MKLLLFLLVLVPAFVRGGTLYFTDFEAFAAGSNKWAGANGWASNDTTSGAQGIIQDPVADLPLGRTGYLGHSRPATRFTTVFRKVDHNPATTGLPLVWFESLLGVQDSTNGHRDRFAISFYNIAGDFLGGIILNNATGTIARDDGVSVTNTGVTFLRGDPILGVAALQIFEAEIDLPGNKWSAWIDGIPIFSGVPFTATAKTRTLGAAAAEWMVTAANVADAGNNWLLVADWLLVASPREPFTLSGFGKGAEGWTLAWPAHAGFDYQVACSDDLVIWQENLPGSTFSSVASDGTLSFTDTTSPVPPRRFYRVERSPSR